MAVIGLMVALLVLSGCPSSDAFPVLNSVVPNHIAAGAADTVVQLNGTGFKKPVVAVWNNSLQLDTTFVNSKQVTAVIPSQQLETARLASIFAMQGSGQNQTATASLTITIGNVAPTLTSMSPQHVIVGAPTFTLTMTGTNFNSSSVANWNTTALTTTFVSATQLTASVPQALYATAGTSKVSVVNPGTGGGTTAQLTMTIVAALSIATTSLPGGSIGASYTATLQAAGGTAPYTWAISTGSLPAGLTLNGSTGVISGTPTAAGSNTFTVQVTDSTGALAIRKMK
jgi:hypothetical protein